MSSQNSLYRLVHAQFHEAFGQPHALQGGGEQWTLPPDPKHKNGIHVLLNGTRDQPGVWIFDPHDQHNGIQNTPITQQRQISELITLIQERLKHADRQRDDTSSPPSLSGI